MLITPPPFRQRYAMLLPLLRFFAATLPLRPPLSDNAMICFRCRHAEYAAAAIERLPFDALCRYRRRLRHAVMAAERLSAAMPLPPVLLFGSASCALLRDVAVIAAALRFRYLRPPMPLCHASRCLMASMKIAAAAPPYRRMRLKMPCWLPLFAAA